MIGSLPEEAVRCRRSSPGSASAKGDRSAPQTGPHTCPTETPAAPSGLCKRCAGLLLQPQSPYQAIHGSQGVVRICIAIYRRRVAGSTLTFPAA